MPTAVLRLALARSHGGRAAPQRQSTLRTQAPISDGFHAKSSSQCRRPSAVCLASAVQQEFLDLAAACGAQLEGVEARPHNDQRGLFATGDVKKDDALLYVPLAVRMRLVTGQALRHSSGYTLC